MDILSARVLRRFHGNAISWRCNRSHAAEAMLRRVSN